MDGCRILIIDDDPGLRKTLTDILRVKGFETLAAGDGGEGLGLLGENAVDLVLIDLGLPDISGLEVLEQIKAEHPATEAIILTGNATLDSAIEATNRGAFSYLLKPYDMEQLLLQVRRAFEKQQTQKEIASRNTELERFNVELETLYKVTSAISRTIDLDRLLSEILDTLAETRLLPFELKGSIFLVEDGTARRAAFRNLSEAVLEPCRTIRSGECLCGQAVATGEIIVSTNSHGDPRHNNCCSRGAPHGHVVLPLKAAERVVGVLTLYTRAEVEVDRRTLNLLATIGSQIGIAIENARLYEETKNSSLHDPLTGLANRRFMEIQLEKGFEAAKRYGERLSVILLDIDHFKRFNDDNGHPEGDRLLRKLAGILSREMRGSDHAFRYGGEEFLLILTQADRDASCRVAERLRKTVEEETEVTISLGVASCQENMEQKEQLVKMADEALYRAKQGGRNRVEIHKPAADSRFVGEEVGLQS
jgi:diguanylate cyclase (GGDEF)-like protein